MNTERTYRMQLALRRNRARFECPPVAAMLARLLGRPEGTLRWLSLEETDELWARVAEGSPFIFEDDRDGPSEAEWRELWVRDREEATARLAAGVADLPEEIVLWHDDAALCGAIMVTRAEVLADPGRFITYGEDSFCFVTADGSAGAHVNADTDSGHAKQAWGVASWSAEI